MAVVCDKCHTEENIHQAKTTIHNAKLGGGAEYRSFDLCLKHRMEFQKLIDKYIGAKVNA